MFHLFADPDIPQSRNFQANQEKRKGRRALRRRPFLATAGSRVRFRCDSRHCVPEQTKSGLLCTWRSASMELLAQRDRRLYRTPVWRECTEGGSHYRIRIQPITRRFIDREVPRRRAEASRFSSRVIIVICTMRWHCEMIKIYRVLNPAIALTIHCPIEAVTRLVNLGLANATKSVIARHQRGIARGTPNRQITCHWHLSREPCQGTRGHNAIDFSFRTLGAISPRTGA